MIARLFSNCANQCYSFQVVKVTVIVYEWVYGSFITNLLNTLIGCVTFWYISGYLENERKLESLIVKRS